MPYVDRDGNGSITGTYSRIQYAGQEFIEEIFPDSTKEISQLYDSAMMALSSRYTQQEINTFHRKSSAAEAYEAGTASVAQIMYLAKVDGQINGELPTTPAESVTLYDTIQADPAQKAIFDAGVAARAARVIMVSHVFDYYTGEIERLRDKRVLQIVDGADNSAVVAALKADYDALTTAYLAATAAI